RLSGARAEIAGFEGFCREWRSYPCSSDRLTVANKELDDGHQNRKRSFAADCDRGVSTIRSATSGRSGSRGKRNREEAAGRGAERHRRGREEREGGKEDRIHSLQRFLV